MARALLKGAAMKFSFAVTGLGLMVTVGACGMMKPPTDNPVDLGVWGPPPVPAALLNSSHTQNQGLLTGIAADGTPVTEGAGADPLIAEAARYVETIGAPATLDDWKRTFGFPQPEAGEDRQAFRDRTGVAVYYNKNELGLGRELGCVAFADGPATPSDPATPDGTAAGAPTSEGVACFVTNHGPGFRAGAAALQAAIDGTEVRNTVCITYRPSADPGYEVQFYVYGAEGRRQEWARLDTLGPRPHPHVCMNCHGGAYDETTHRAKNARFLPLDPGLVTFAEAGDGVPAGVTRAGQEERLRVMNALATRTPLSRAQRAMLDDLYGGPHAVEQPGTVVTGDGVPQPWKAHDADREFYLGVVKPYCATCHLAGDKRLGDAELASAAIFNAPAAFDAANLDALVCNNFAMPNAQPTSLAFWDTQGNPGVMVGGVLYAAAADAFLARRGQDRTACAGLAQTSGCNRGEAPDLLCGGDVSGGALCDASSGRCAPVMSTSP